MGLLDRAGLPPAHFRSLTQAVGRRVRVLAWAQGVDGLVVGLAHALAIPTTDGWRFVGWHEIDTGGWSAETRRLRWRLVGGASDEVVLEQPGSLPELFRDRVEASIVVHERFELPRGRAALIVARRRLDDDRAPLIWLMTRLGGSFDEALSSLAEAELGRLRAEYDIA